MNDDELLRYSRQIMLPQVDVEGQQRLADSCVLIIGLGGLGSPVAMYLAAAGVGQLELVDFDKVDITNLQRQILHSTDNIGQAKTESALQRLQQINPLITINIHNEKLEGEALIAAAKKADVVVDASDNFATRFAINRACLAAKTPLVSAAAIRMEGQISVFQCDDPAMACYQCLYQDTGEEDTNCTSNGVLAPMVGILGSMQALETLKLLLNIGESLAGKLMLFDGMTMEWRTMKLRKDSACPACNSTS
ncbi:MAG: molybdopterin-synthase adenylyltransferase MoeB [Sulfuriflexus sp.]|nr:molybdopterin-synthase adenylyltransferase MoeB [Sulfuriflexus sp.]